MSTANGGTAFGKRMRLEAPSPTGRTVEGWKELKGWMGGDRRFRLELNFTGGAREARGLDGAKERKWKEKRILHTQPEGCIIKKTPHRTAAKQLRTKVCGGSFCAFILKG